MDYYGNRYNETFRYVQVSPIDWSEHEEYKYIVDGALEITSDTDLKVSGSFSFQGPEIPNQNYMLRIYYSFIDENNDRIELPMATLYIDFSNIKYTDILGGMLYSGSLTGSSVLKLLQEKKYGEPFIVKRNENPIYKAQSLISEFGLRINYTPSSYALSSDHVFAPGEDYLTIVNWLCSIAGYENVYTDPNGIVQLHPKKIIKDDDQDLLVFKNDNKSIMYPEVDNESTWLDSHNVVKLVYATDKDSMIATAKNLRGSRNSLESLNGREKTRVDDIGELGGLKGTKAEKLLSFAEQLLVEESKETEYVIFSHAFLPMYIYNGVKIVYSDMEWVGEVINMSITLSPSVKTQTKIKKTIFNQIEIEKFCKVYRSSDSTNSSIDS